MTRKVQSGFRPNSFGKFGLVHPNWAPIRVLDVNPNLSLHGKSSRPYIRGCRLIDPTPIEQTHLQLFHVHQHFIPLPCIFLLVLRRSSRLEAATPRGSRGGQADLGQPIAAASPDGVPPRRAGFRVYKSARRTVLRIVLPVSLPRSELRSISLGAAGTRDVFVCQKPCKIFKIARTLF